ncbi:Glycosyl transferase [Streptococcus pneumoniae]|uniref:Glycosyl transferase n=1 Tax=Streptococcus pneumoniae TaxID=1313 RepID=A0A4J1ZYF2_STREE|nr:Glycosyl transferase [Streptococcus pneumoniae]VMH47359.1 Glycosyl transferase [Streptococcus pneumoniae]VNP35552.1 Glycosyl transferase [Streptococcus pneumoniae]VNQ10987.1 Glycosyl transferase [Streptococcus pneumoniae]
MLDSDTVVNAKLDDLFTLDIQGYAIAAVQDFNHEGWLTTFNSGVMLIDAQKWREKKINTKFARVDCPTP